MAWSCRSTGATPSPEPWPPSRYHVHAAHLATTRQSALAVSTTWGEFMLHLSAKTLPSAHTRARARADGVDRRERAWGVGGERVNGSRHGRIRGHRPEHRRRGAQHRHIRQAVPAERERERHIDHDLGRVVPRGRLAPRRQRLTQSAVQTADPHRLDQGDTPACGHDPGPGRIHANPRIKPATLVHLKGAPRLAVDGPSASPILAGQEHLSVDRHGHASRCP